MIRPCGAADVPRIFAIVNREGDIKADPFRIFPQQAGADAVKRTCPD